MGRTKKKSFQRKKAYVFKNLKMSYSSDLDRALDGLGFSYIDGVPFRLDSRIENVSNYDYSRTNELLQRPLPGSGLSNMCTNLIENIGVLEKQVLEQLKNLDAEKEAKKEKERKEEEELENKRIARAKLVKEQEELEVVENGDDGESESPADTETEPSTASISDF